MKIQNLKDVFQRFSKDNNRAILVDGSWGTGKTYYVLQFLKDSKKLKQKIVYVSLFGKSNIDEVHTEIYSRLHPIKENSKKIIQVIPKIAPLLGTVGDIIDNLEYVLKSSDAERRSVSEHVSEDSDAEGKSVCERRLAIEDIADNLQSLNDSFGKTRINSSPKHRNIIILDDFERLDFEKISFTDVLGYVNSLFMQNFKVIVVCNSKEIPHKEENNFSSFKEKVFDREYVITATNRDIINSYFSQDKIFLDERIIDEFDNNLRIAQRVSNFYFEAVDAIARIDPNYLKITTKENILFGCTLVVIACNTSKYTQAEPANANLTDMMMLASLQVDESLHKIIIGINKYLIDKGLGQINNQLIASLLQLYYYNDITGLSRLLGINEFKVHNPLLEEAFWLSDDEKEKLFLRQFSYITQESKINVGNVYQCVKSMCEYHMYSHIDDHEDEIIFNLLQKCDEKDIHRIADIHFVDEKENLRFVKFKNKFREKRLETLVSNMCSDLRILYSEKKYPVIMDKINAVSREDNYAIVKEGKRYLAEDILDTIKECNFFIDDLFGNISYSQWSLAHQICELSNDYNFSDQLREYINNMDFNADRSAQERYTYLIQKKLNQ